MIGVIVDWCPCGKLSEDQKLVDVVEYKNKSHPGKNDFKQDLVNCRRAQSGYIKFCGKRFSLYLNPDRGCDLCQPLSITQIGLIRMYRQ